MAEQTVEGLARLAQGGSPAAREALARRVRPILADRLRRRGCHPDDIEDVCQETLLRAFRSLPGYDPERSFTAWVGTIADNVTVSRYRKRVPTPASHRMAEPPDTAPTPAEAAGDADRSASIWTTARRVLSDRQHLALRLHYAEGLDVRAVAARLGLTRTHVKVLLHRARKRLLACPELKDEV